MIKKINSADLDEVSFISIMPIKQHCWVVYLERRDKSIALAIVHRLYECILL